MAGEAITKSFMLATATVMVGPQQDLYKFQPSTHSIGLVKNFSLTSEPEYTELRQGVQNTLVDSTMTNNTISASMEVYEYTAKNLSYGLGLDGSDLAETTEYLTSSTTAADAVTIELADASDNSADFTAGKFVYIQKGTSDEVHVAKLASNATHSTGVTTLTLVADRAVPIEFAAGTKVALVHDIAIGSKEAQPYFAAKITGTLPDGKPIVIEFPKLRIQRGFTLSFQSDDYGNLPFEFAPYDVTTGDDFTGVSGPDLYTDFKGMNCKVYIGT